MRELGLVLLATDLLGGRQPEEVNAPTRLPAELPSDGGPSDEARVLTFWNPPDGPLATLADLPAARHRPGPALDWLENIQRQYPGDRWRDAVDPSRSPVIRLARSSWTADGRLRSGRFGAMTSWAPREDQTAAIREKTRSAEEWLRAKGERLEPPGARPGQRKRRQAGVIWVLPEAARWLREGGELVWPD